MSFKVYLMGKEIAAEVLPPDIFSENAGIFESLRTYGGQFFRLEEHLKRFAESAQTAGFRDQIDVKQIRESLQTALRAYLKEEKPKAGEDCFFRVTWWRGAVYVMIGSRKYPQDFYRTGVALQTSAVKRSVPNALPAGAKTTDYVNALMATLELKPADVYEWLFLDPQGFVTEVRVGNFFIVKDGVILTPPAAGILNGVTRRFVIECARVLRFPVREIPVTRHEVYNADEAFLTNTSWEILPVCELDRRKIGSQVPGPITRQLQQTFKKRALRECR